MTYEEVKADVLAVKRACKGPEGGAGCGYDFNEIVLAHPFDGQIREYKCPKCGTEGTFRSPVYELT